MLLKKFFHVCQRDFFYQCFQNICFIFSALENIGTIQKSISNGLIAQCDSNSKRKSSCFWSSWRVIVSWMSLKKSSSDAELFCIRIRLNSNTIFENECIIFVFPGLQLYIWFLCLKKIIVPHQKIRKMRKPIHSTEKWNSNIPWFLLIGILYAEHSIFNMFSFRLLWRFFFLWKKRIRGKKFLFVFLKIFCSGNANNHIFEEKKMVWCHETSSSWEKNCFTFFVPRRKAKNTFGEKSVERIISYEKNSFKWFVSRVHYHVLKIEERRWLLWILFWKNIQIWEEGKVKRFRYSSVVVEIIIFLKIDFLSIKNQKEKMFQKWVIPTLCLFRRNSLHLRIWNSNSYQMTTHKKQIEDRSVTFYNNHIFIKKGLPITREAQMLKSRCYDWKLTVPTIAGAFIFRRTTTLDRRAFGFR